MKINSHRTGCRLALGAVLLASTVASGSDVSEDLRNCAVLADSADRLRCFDRLAAAERPGATTPEASTQVRAAASRSARSDENRPQEPVRESPRQPADPVESFGFDEAAARHRAPAGGSDVQVPDSIHAMIEKIEERAWGERVFYLDNGHVWLETSRSRKLLLSPGDAVTVKAAMSGSYRLFESGGKRATRVKRLE